jgi:hypothetical protein
MEVDTMSGPPAPEVKAEECSQKGEKATYKSFKYVFIFTWILKSVDTFKPKFSA